MIAALTFAQVHQIRTAGLTDRWWADKLRVGITTVFRARRGESHKDHPTTEPVSHTSECPELLVDLRHGMCSSSLCKQLRAVAADEIERLEAQSNQLLEALRAVVSVADRKTDEFDLAHAAIANATGEHS